MPQQVPRQDEFDALAVRVADLERSQTAQDLRLTSLGEATEDLLARVVDHETRLTTLETPPPPPPVDCVLSEFELQSFGDWGSCQPDHTQIRSEEWVREILTEPANGGAPCGPLTERRTGVQACVYVPPPPPPPPPPPNGNAYYDEGIVTHPAFWKGLSLRPRDGAPAGSPYDAQQYATYGHGTPSFITYDPVVDAAKVVILAFLPRTALGVALSATDTRVIPATWSSAYVVNAQVKVDDEILVITAPDPSSVSPRGFAATRAQYGTTATSHAAGTMLFSANNSSTQLRFPLGTADGNTYLFTWDARFDTSWMATGLAGNKTFQLTSGGDAIWLETKTMCNGANAVPPFDPLTQLAGLGVRSYNQPYNGATTWAGTNGNMLGPGTIRPNPLEPLGAPFTLFPNRWTRYWILIEQRVNDWDRYSSWMADEQQAPVPIYVDVPISVRPPDFSILKWWIEFNDSDPRLPAGRTTDFRDLVAHVKNFGALRNPGDITSLLVRPSGA